MKPDATEPDSRHLDLDQLFAAEAETDRARAPRIIYPPVSGRGPADWFPDENADGAARAPAAAVAQPVSGQDATSPTPVKQPARDARPAPDRSTVTARRPAARPSPAAPPRATPPRRSPDAVAAGVASPSWDETVIDRGVAIPAARRRLRWLTAAAVVVGLGLGAVAARSLDILPAQGTRLPDALTTIERWWAAAWPAPAPAGDALPPATTAAADASPAPPRPAPSALPPPPAPPVAAADQPPPAPARTLGDGTSRTTPTTGTTASADGATARRSVTVAAPTPTPTPTPSPTASVTAESGEPMAAGPAPPPASPTLSSLTLPAGTPVAGPPASARNTPSAVPPSNGVAASTAAGTSPAAPAPAPPAAAPTATADSERRAVLNVLSRYEAAYSSLNADAAAAVYPEIDKRALARAFEALDAQNVRLKQCEIDMGIGTARAACFGTASWTPRVGSGRQAQDRRWDFALRQSAGVWTIDSVRVR